MRLTFAIAGCVLTLACGASLPEPADSVHVKVTICEPTLGTSGQYLRLASWRRGQGICETMLESSEDRRRAIREVAERDVDRLNREFDVYLASGQTDCYNGPVFNEMQNLVEEKRRDGILCREP